MNNWQIMYSICWNKECQNSVLHCCDDWSIIILKSVVGVYYCQILAWISYCRKRLSVNLLRAFFISFLFYKKWYAQLDWAIAMMHFYTVEINVSVCLEKPRPKWTNKGRGTPEAMLDIFDLHNSYLNKIKQFKYFLIMTRPASELIAIKEWQSFFGVTDKS